MANPNEHELNNPVLIHEQLNPVLWDTDTNKLLPDVREALLNVYNDFLKSNFTDNSVTIPVVDLHLLGSQAGYNYTDHSDIDLHLLVNFELLYESDDVLQLLYQTVTRKFNSDLDVTVKGIPVELYIQDLKSVNKSTGVYSVFEDKWIQEPGQPTEIDQETLETANEIADELITATQAVLDNREDAKLTDVEQLINDIYVVRKQSLTEFNEFSAGNLAFKILRNTGMLDEIKELHKELRGKELSLTEDNKLGKAPGISQFSDKEMKRIMSSFYKSIEDLKKIGYTTGTIRDLVTQYLKNGVVEKMNESRTAEALDPEAYRDYSTDTNSAPLEKDSSGTKYFIYYVVSHKNGVTYYFSTTEGNKIFSTVAYKEILDYMSISNLRTFNTREKAQQFIKMFNEKSKYPDKPWKIGEIKSNNSQVKPQGTAESNELEGKHTMMGDKPMMIKKEETAEVLKEDREQDEILDLLSKLQKKAENIDFDYYNSNLNLTEVIELIDKLRNNYCNDKREKLEEDVNSQETFADTSAAANLTALVNSEIEAISLYTSVLETCTCEKTKAVLDEILQDEKDHINLLSNLIDSLVSEAFPSDETVEEIVEKTGMSPVTDETVNTTDDDMTAIATDSEVHKIIPVVSLNESIFDKDNVDGLIQDYRENAFGYDGVRDNVETQYPMHDKETKDKLIKLMSKQLTEDVDGEETEIEVEDKTEDIEQATDDLIDEVKSMGFEVNDDNTFSVTGTESGYTATVSVNSDNSFSVTVTESNRDILESITITDKDELFDYLNLLKSEDNENAVIEEDVDDDYESDFYDNEVQSGNSFFADGYDWKWLRRVGDVVHLDFDNWAVWMAGRPENENNPGGRNVVAFFIVDEDTGFVDWGPVDTVKEAQEFLQSKVDDYNNDDLDKFESLNESSYGGAYDISDNQYFTREDINELADYVIDILNLGYSKFQYNSVYLEPENVIELEIEWNDYTEVVKQKIDMRKIKRPSDLSSVYAPIIADKVKEAFKEYGADFGPHELNESSQSNDRGSFHELEETNSNTLFTCPYCHNKTLVEVEDGYYVCDECGEEGEGYENYEGNVVLKNSSDEN